MPAALERLARVTRRIPPSRAKVRVGRAITAMLDAMGLDPVCEATLRDGTRIILDPRSRTEAGAFWNGEHEGDYVSLLKRLCDTYGTCVYDVGANVGLVALPLANHVRGGGRVVAFEPVHENFRRLMASVSLNNLTATVLAHECALGATDGLVKIAREAQHSASTGNAVLLPAGAADSEARVSQVALRRLDDLVREHRLPLPDVVKLDVEGSEVGFLAGATETLGAARPVILGEFNSLYMPRFGTTFLDAAAVMAPLDYRIFAFAGVGKLHERSPEVGLGDVLLVPDEKVAQLPLMVT